MENIGVEIWVIAKLFEQIKLPHFGCWENISQNIINLLRPLWKRGEEDWSGWKLDLLFTLLTHFLKTLQAALDFEMKSLKIRDLLHLCQSSLGIIERNNLPNASLAKNSRNLSGPTPSRPAATFYRQKVRFVSKVNREHVIDWVKTQWRLFIQVNGM